MRELLKGRLKKNYSRHPHYLRKNKGRGFAGKFWLNRQPFVMGRKKLETRPPRTTSFSVSNPVSFEEERRREGVGFPTTTFRIYEVFWGNPNRGQKNGGLRTPC